MVLHSILPERTSRMLLHLPMPCLNVWTLSTAVLTMMNEIRTHSGKLQLKCCVMWRMKRLMILLTGSTHLPLFKHSIRHSLIDCITFVPELYPARLVCGRYRFFLFSFLVFE